MEYDVSTFGFKSTVFIVTYIYGDHSPTEVKDIIMYYPSITQVMVDSHCEILWGDNSGSDLGCHPIANYAAGLDDTEEQSIITQQRLRSNIIFLWIKNSLTTDTKRKLRAFNYAYTFNTQDDGAAMFFVIFKMVRPDTHRMLRHQV